MRRFLAAAILVMFTLLLVGSLVREEVIMRPALETDRRIDEHTREVDLRLRQYQKAHPPPATAD